ncbi:MAG: response regulator, partial [Planctomycetota bacterium]
INDPDPIDDPSITGTIPSAEEIGNLLSQLAPAPTAPATPSPANDSDRAAVAGGDAAAATASGDAGSIDDDVESLSDELREAFLDDAGRCIGVIEECVLKLEGEPQHRGSVDQILRELHTIKGASASVGMTRLADYVHHCEDNIRDSLQQDQLPAVADLFTQLDTIRGAANKLLPEAAQAGNDATPNGAPAASPAPIDDCGHDDDTVRVKAAQLNRLMDMLSELLLLRNHRDSQLTEMKTIQQELLNSVSRMRILGDAWQMGARANDLSGDGGVVPGKLPYLAEVASDVLESAQRIRDVSRPIEENNSAISTFIRDFRQELVQLRRLPIAGLFRRLHRAISDAARAEEKQVRFVTLGDQTGIERSLQERVYEPLMHIVRNGVSHGIETPAEREAAGKPAHGTLTIEAQSGPDLLTIEVRDDGKGLDYEALRRRGIERGFITSGQAVSREELAQLIFRPGFSTREVASAISGRGVGMDVVASTLNRMRGWIQIESVPGHGTTMRVNVPIPSLIQHTMVFRCAGQLFAVPMQFVRVAGNPKAGTPTVDFAEMLGHIPDPGEPRESLLLACGVNSTVDRKDESARQGDAGPRERHLTLKIDEVVGPEEVVVRPLPALLRQHPYCIGATLSSEGTVVQVLDTNQLMGWAGQQSPVSSDAVTDLLAAMEGGGSVVKEASGFVPTVLVVDDSMSARRRLIQLLTRFNVNIIEANDGTEALDRLESEPVDVVFTDLEMPGMDGFELLSQLKSDPRHHGIPVTMITSRTEPEVIQRAEQLGALACLPKPIAEGRLDEIVQHLAVLQNALEVRS